MRISNLLNRILMLSLTAFVLFVFGECSAPKCPTPENLTYTIDTTSRMVTYKWTAAPEVLSYSYDFKINETTIHSDTISPGTSVTLPLLPLQAQSNNIKFSVRAYCNIPSNKETAIDGFEQVPSEYASKDFTILGDIASVAIVYPTTDPGTVGGKEEYFKWDSTGISRMRGYCGIDTSFKYLHGNYYKRKNYIGCMKYCPKKDSLKNCLESKKDTVVESAIVLSPQISPTSICKNIDVSTCKHIHFLWKNPTNQNFCGIEIAKFKQFDKKYFYSNKFCDCITTHCNTDSSDSLIKCLKSSISFNEDHDYIKCGDTNAFRDTRRKSS